MKETNFIEMEDEWKKAQTFEKNWWMNARKWHAQEIQKGDIVGRLMFVDKGVQKSVIDIGCGPFSLLQRVPVSGRCVAVDPIYYDDLEEGYKANNIERLIKCGEDLTSEDGVFDEAWIYNCLQHVKDPVKILENAMKISSTIRIFEWTHIPPYEGHLHELTPEGLSFPFKKNRWNTVMETRGFLNHSGLNGNYYMAIFSKESPAIFRV